MAGVTGSTNSSDVLDVITVLMFEIPAEQLRKYRDRLNRSVAAARVRAGQFDRRTWGLQPDQIVATQRLMGRLSNPGGV